MAIQLEPTPSQTDQNIPSLASVLIFGGCIVVSNDVSFKTKMAVRLLRTFYGTRVGLCDGTADEVQIQAALDALPTTGGVVALSAGKFYSNTAGTAVTVTDKNGRSLVGQGIGATEWQQAGAGNILDLLGTSEIVNCYVGGLTLHGTDNAAKGINLQNAKDSLLDRVQVSHCLGTGIDFNGVNSVNNTLRGPGRITAGTTTTAASWPALQTASGLSVAGNVFRCQDMYFNIGATAQTLTITDATNATPIVVTSAAHGLANGLRVFISGVLGNTGANGDWVVANKTDDTFELTGSAGTGAYTSGGTIGVRRYVSAITTTADTFISQGNAFDGVSFGIKGNKILSMWDYFDMSSSLKLLGGVYPTANNMCVVMECKNSVVRDAAEGQATLIYNPSHAVTDKYISTLANDGLGGFVGGVVMGHVITPSSFAADQNDYAPTGGRYSTTWRLTATGALRNITGILAGIDGQVLHICNIGTQSIVLQNENAGSAAANRIITNTGADVTLVATYGSATIVYDSTSARWRMV